MKSINLIALLTLLLTALGMQAQVVTTTPAVLQESSSNVVIYYHADQGSKGLINQSSSDPIYAHTGVITNLSTSNSDWKHASTWSKNEDKYKMTYVSANLWKLEIGDIRTFYNVTNASETVKQLAFVFRNSDGTKEGKTASGGDIFVDVMESGLQVKLSADIDGFLVQENHKNVAFTVSSTQAANLALKVNGSTVASQNSASSLAYTYNFTTTGTYTITAEATLNGNTVTDEMTLTYPKASEARQYPGGTPKMGCVKNSDGSVTFCIAAPSKSSAILVGSWDDYKVLDTNTMYYQDYQGNRYFWYTVSGLSNTEQYPYYFLIDGTGVGDPYARLILDPYSDKYLSSTAFPNLIDYPTAKIGSSSIPLAVYQGNINDYDWKVKNFKGVDKSKLIIYELLVRDFTGTEGQSNGEGTIRGAIDKLDYLQDLHINAIELLPITEFNGNNSWGYNPNFYFAPDKAYGTPDDYKAFIDECHSRGIAVILDMVFNQSDGLHPWYQLYPIASNPFYNATAPHAYSVLNDWKQDNDLVQQQFKDCLKYWLSEYKVDGFRFDLVKGLGDNASYPNSGDSGTGQYNATRVARMKALHAAMKEVNEDAYFINENLAGAQEENEMATDGELNWANINTAGAQFAMGYSSDSNLGRFYAPYDSSRTWGSTVSYLESHDEERLAYKQNQYGASGVKGSMVPSMSRLGSAMAQMILSPGAHMIWQFSELGNFESTKSEDGNNNTDPKKVNWNLFKNANRKGLYNTICALNGIRLMNPDLFEETASFTSQCSDGNWETGRFMYLSTANKELIVVINPNINSEKTFTTTFKSHNNNDYQILASTYNTTPTFDAVNSKVTVPSNSFVVLGNKNVSEVKTVMSDRLDSDATVYGAQGRIVVEGSYDNIAIYNIAGERFNTLTLPAGIYIAVVDGTPHKVIVK
jgi:1,4-alpha-glucan branching enzyme